MIEAIDQFLLDVYAAPRRAGGWVIALDGVRQALDLESAIIQELAPVRDRFKTLWMARDAHSERSAARHETVVSDAINPRMIASPGPVRELRHVAILSDDDFGIPKSRLAGFHAALETVGLGDFLCVRLPGPAQRGASLILHRRAGDRRGYGDDEKTFLSRIGLHLSQALAIKRDFADHQAQLASTQAALDQMRFGVIICDGEASFLAANEAARRILSAEGAIRLRDGRICSDEASATRGLRSLIARAADSDASGGDEDRLFSIVARDGGGAVLQIFATPVAGGEGRLALVLGGDTQPGAFNVRAFARLFELSPAEARIVRALAAGATVQGFAAELGLSEGTIRLQLKRALAKTGCGRQSDLVRLVCASPLWSAIPLSTTN